MHDGVSLETKGVPTAVVVTSEFVREAAVQRAALGMDDLAPAVISHPLSTLTDEEIDQRVAQAVDQVGPIWLSA